LALWGELMSTRARYLCAAGDVLNGFVRDAAGIEALGFPTFCRGVYAQDQGPRGEVIDFRTSIEIEGVRIAPGDLIFGDREGVLVIPSDVESETVAAALAKASTENKVAIAMPPASQLVEHVTDNRREQVIAQAREQCLVIPDFGHELLLLRRRRSSTSANLGTTSVLMDSPDSEFVLAGSLDELKRKAGSSCTAAIARSWLFMTGAASSRSTQPTSATVRSG
jgi:hypothetical protein